MRLHTIPHIKGATHRPKRLGSGEGNGHGKTCGRGQKGSKCRSDYSIPPGFEGGQMPLYRRLPKRGFSNYQFRTKYEIVNLEDLKRFKNPAHVIDRKALIKAGLIRDNAQPLKVLGEGSLVNALKIVAHRFSAAAKDKIIAAGGEAILIEKSTQT